MWRYSPRRSGWANCEWHLSSGWHRSLSVLYSYVREKCISRRSCMDMVERAEAQSMDLDAPRVT